MPRSSAVAERDAATGTAPRWHRLEPPAPENPAVELVWLPGWGQTAESLEPLARLLAARARSLVFDLPGFGETPMLAEGAGSADYADALIEQLGDRPARRVLVGHSFGARVAIQAAARHRQSVDALVLIAAAGLQRRRSLAWRLRASFLKRLGRGAGAIDRLCKTRLRAAYARRFGSEDYRKAGALRPTLVRVVNEDLSSEASHLTLPVLLVYGAEDTATPPELGRRYAAMMGNAELHVLDGFGHLDILANGAYQCQNLIERFLARLD